MIKVTLDTNILISGSFWTGDCFRILQLIDCKKIACFLSKEILEEYNQVIHSEEIIEKVENKSLILSKIIESVLTISYIVEPTIKLSVVKEDPRDNIILECAKFGNVGFIITNDNHLLKLKEFEGIKIIKPDEFIKILK